MYDKDRFQVANQLNRFATGYRVELKYNADDWLGLYLQCKSPGADKECNCSPVSITLDPWDDNVPLCTESRSARPPPGMRAP
jgi:hypothetical protein